MRFRTLDDESSVQLRPAQEQRFRSLGTEAKNLPSYLSKNESELREEVELHGWEKTWQELDARVRSNMGWFSHGWGNRMLKANPLTAVAGYWLGKTRERTAEGMVLPFAKYALPSEREIFEQLSPDDQNRALAWEGVGAALWALSPTLKAAKGPAKKLAAWRNSRRFAEMLPIEEALSKLKNEKGLWRAFDQQTTTVRMLKSEARLADDEAKAIASVIKGEDSVVLKALEYEKGLEGKPMSKAWKSFLEPAKPGTPYGKPTLVAEAAEKYSYTNMQAKHYSELFRHNLAKTGKKAKPYFAENLMKQQAERFYGPQVAEGISFASMSEKEMANMLASMLSPRGKKIYGSMHKLAMGEYRLPWVRPERDVYGAGEVVFRTKSKVFDKLVNAFGNSNRYTVEKMSTFMQMLEQRGFGTMKQGKRGMEFVPDKDLWTTTNLRDAYELLKQIDDVAEAGRKGKLLSKTESVKLVTDMMDKAKTETPVVAEIVGAVRDYSDYLYKDLLITYIPKTLRRFGLTQKGEALAYNLERLWIPKIQDMFSANSAASHVDRVKLVKGFLKDVRKSFKADSELFLAEGKKLEAQVEDLLGRFAYGSTKPGGIPAYLEHYMPRISKGGASFEAKWKQALTGEAGYMKHRTSVTSGELVKTLQEVIEGRTRAQAKQLYLYDEISDVVNYAKKLPESWQMHTDFTISRLLGKPSSWDEKLATILQKTPFTGNWDSYRAMRVAQKLTGLQYTGLIGLRPFAVFRNLTQPIIMTGAELGGGVRDNLAVMRGLAKVGSKKHREYIRSIGAITEYVPDYARGPILPKTGAAARWDSTRDAFMFMFRKSDEMNRYWSGGAAVDKWEYAAKATTGGIQNTSAFLRKLKIKGQQQWIQTEVESLLRLGRLNEAKASYVRNIVANTQYLYGVLDAPSMTGVGGAQKLVTSFNSWWMNYGTALSRWATTGSGTEQVKRMGTWLVSSLAAEQMLEAWAGRGTASRSTFLGPLPLGTVGMPPALDPMAQMFKTLAQTTSPEVIAETTAREKAYRTGLSALRSAATTFVPGGLLAKQAYKGYKESEDFAGLAAGILQFHRNEEFEPLFGIGQ